LPLDGTGTCGIRYWSFFVFDYHVHTEFSVDCNVPMRDLCEAAIEAGITEIAFTDHVDHQPSDPGCGYYNAEAYFASLERVRGEFGDRLTILAGAEIDYHEEIEDPVRRFVEAYGQHYDFVIGSVHYGASGTLIYPQLYEQKAVSTVFTEYFDQVIRAIETRWFDTIGHLDIPKRYLPSKMRDYDPAMYRAGLEPVFEALIATEVAFEINTSGIRQAPKASMPGPAIVRWYAEAGGQRITTGTDSHGTRTVGANLRDTLHMLRLCGIESILSYRHRQAKSVAIDDLIASPEDAAIA
jgi:histidinol-phosphatase (PHP family)